MDKPTLTKVTALKTPSGILDAAICKDEQSLVAACMDGVYLIDLNDKTSAKIGRHASYASAAAAIPFSDTVVTTGYDGVVKWFDLTSRAEVREKKIHNFWSWDMCISPDGRLIASSTGQYIAAGYKYEPAAETEPSVRLVDAATGDVLYSLSHGPPVQAIAFSNDGRFVAAGNMMGEVRIWSTSTGQLESTFTTDAFTSWGIIKSHCYLGGIFAMRFTQDGNALLLAGMGPMRDPMAGNGRQLWQKWHWQNEATLIDETHDGESGEGLMETLAIHSENQNFVMGGRLRGGDWNAAVFAADDGRRLTSLKTGFRITEAQFTRDGSKLILAGMQGQPHGKKAGKFPDFGRLEIYDYNG